MMRVLDIVFGALGLLLVLRAVLQVFGMRWAHPVLQIVVKVTDPVIKLTNRVLGIPAYRSTYRAYGTGHADVLNAATALVVLWFTRTIITWALQTVLLVPGWVAQPWGAIGGILRHILTLLFELYGVAIFVRVLFAWIQVPYSSKVTRFAWTITEPLLAPIRRVLPALGGLDFSPVIAFLLLRLLQQVVFSLLAWVF
jgi:YggT family protein